MVYQISSQGIQGLSWRDKSACWQGSVGLSDFQLELSFQPIQGLCEKSMSEVHLGPSGPSHFF